MPARSLNELQLMAAVAMALVLLVTGSSASAAAAEQRGNAAERQRVIVVLHDGVDSPGAAARDIAERHGGDVGLVYQHAVKGFSASFPAGALDDVRHDRRVAFVELDQVATTFSHAVPTGIERIFADDNPNLGIDGSDDARINVDVAVIDTGLDSDHADLNIVGGVDCSGGSPSRASCIDGTFEDGNGHGTHVGGTIAAIDNAVGVVGVAPGARLHGVKVLSDRGSGYTSWIIAGIDWVTANADVIEVANMSLGCECSSAAQDEAIANSVKAGVTYAVAAGNSDKDSSTFSPANHPDVITVSALADFDGEPGGLADPTCRTDQDDTLADFSNFGADVEITAPGVCILSTWNDGGYHTISGTSMASPHVAGAAALLAASGSPTPAEIRSTLIAEGNSVWTDDSGDGIKEPLLDVSDSTVFDPATVAGDDGSAGGTNTTPTAEFTHSCTDLACDFTDASSDSDGTIASWSWDFGDGAASTAQNPTHSYDTDGTYTVTLTVTDDGGATGTTSQDVTVASGTDGFTLSVSAYKVKGVQHADLTWTGTNATNVDIHRNGVLVTTTANDGAYTDNIGKKSGGSYTYQVCEADTSTCSNEATATF